MNPLLAGFGEKIFDTAYDMYQQSESRDYNEEMASTMHQREVEDLRKAGLNPILSAKGGGSAVQAVPTPQAHSMDIGGKMLQSQALAQQRELMNAQIQNVQADTRSKIVSANVAERTQTSSIDAVREGLYKLRGEADLTYDERIKLQKILKQLDVEYDIKKNEKASSGLDLYRLKNEAQFEQGPGGTASPYLRRLLEIIRTIK